MNFYDKIKEVEELLKWTLKRDGHQSGLEEYDDDKHKDDFLGTDSYRTHRVDCIMRQPSKEIDIDKVRKIIKEGIDLDFQDTRGYTFIERSGLIDRLDLADLFSRAKYQEI